MGDDYRDLEKRERLGDPSPPVSRCSACRGTTRVRGERCPECDGGGTLDAQKAYMGKLVACAAAEVNPRNTRHVVLAKGAAIVDLGAPILELDKLTLGPGDVLVWRTSAKVTRKQVRIFSRLVRDSLPFNRQPSVILAIPFGSGGLDSFNVGSGVSDEGIRLGLREHADRLQELMGEQRPLEGVERLLDAQTNDSGRTGSSEGDSSVKVQSWHETLDELLDEALNENVRQATVKLLREVVDRRGFELRAKLTFAELMAERERWMLGPPRDTREERERIAEALEAECLKVIECDSQGLFTALSDALAVVTEAVNLHGRFLMVVMSSDARSKLGNPNSIHGVMVPAHMHGLTPDDRILVVAVREGELWDPGHAVVVRWTDTGDPLAGLELVKEEPNPDKCMECGHKGFVKYKGVCKCSVCGRQHVQDGSGVWTTVSVADEEHDTATKYLTETAKVDKTPPAAPLVSAIFAERIIGGYGNDSLVCFCEEKFTVDRCTVVALINCDCGRELKRTKVTKEGSMWEVRGEPQAEQPKPIEYDPLRDPEFVYAIRGTRDEWSRQRDELKCVCGVAWMSKREAADEKRDCICGRHLRKVQVTTKGSKWEVRGEPKVIERVVARSPVKEPGPCPDTLVCVCGAKVELGHLAIRETCKCGRRWDGVGGRERWRLTREPKA